MPTLSPIPAADARQACEREIARLFDWAAAVEIGDIPEDAQSRAVLVLFDDIAAMVGAAAEPEFQRVLPKLLGPAQGGEASVFCQPGLTADKRTAALANAVSANWLELDEGYRATPCHAGLYLLPALLAEAQAGQASLQDVLRAVVVGYETITRIARAFAQRPAVMQSHGRFAAVGAAIAVALIRRLPPGQCLAAASAAATLITPAPRNHLALGALVRNMWAGVGAQTGMAAVDWADAGIGGTPGSFYDVYCTVLRGECDPSRLTEGLGAEWAVMEGYTKMFACCQHLHAAIEAVLDIREAVLAKGLDGIAGIEVQTHELALPLDNARPHNTLAAKFSMSHAVAAALVTGQGGAGAFGSGMLAEPRVGRLRDLVSMSPWPQPVPAPPNDRPARVRVRFDDATQLEASCLSARGGADRPFPAQARLAKIGELTAATYPRLAQTADVLLALPAGRLRQAWREIVQDFTAA